MEFIKANKRIINYILFGAMTTLVNIISYAFFARMMGIDYKLATTLAWVLAVLFAFVTNKLYVFDSKSKDFALVMREFCSFIFFRLLSYGIDILGMILLVETLKTDDIFAKIAANVF